jgi:hypothetical protein
MPSSSTPIAMSIIEQFDYVVCMFFCFVFLYCFFVCLFVCIAAKPQWLQNSEPILGLACLRSVDSGSLGRRWGQATITKIFFFGAISQLGVQEGALARVVVDYYSGSSRLLQTTQRISLFLLLARSIWLAHFHRICLSLGNCIANLIYAEAWVLL